MNRLIITDSLNPWHNLALEDMLFDIHREGCCLYLWQNQNTVVIGRAQNAWKECRIDELEKDGGKLARRTSGGGAVFHDLGNLNFTFTASEATYDLHRQLQVIIDAVASLGIKASFTGRNDIVTESGAKFSGNAFRKANGVSMHHGTILINADMGKLGRYLMPSKAKLRSKGVESIRSRVANLNEYMPGIAVEDVRQAIISAFKKEYGCCDMIAEQSLDQNDLAQKEEFFSSWEWNKGESPKFDLSLENRFDWGEVQLLFTARNGRIAEAQLYTDAMDDSVLSKIPGLLLNSKFDPLEMSNRIAVLRGNETVDIANWIKTIKV
ncbi:MAG: lipoate--protein ligase [Eubacteriales bacterium]|nr:lipoate--protein ligase [Eubacteriales bacterium]